MRSTKIKKINKTVVITGYTCNNNCVFCIDAQKRSLPNQTTKDVMRAIKDAHEGGSSYLELIGGETTIRSDFFDLIAFAKRVGFSRISVATNGRMISIPSFVNMLKRCGKMEIILSIHGHCAALHDKLTRAPGSFRQLMSGLKKLKKCRNIITSSNTTVVKQNYKDVPNIARLLKRNNIHNAEFIFVDPTQGGAHERFSACVPKISFAAPYMKKAIDIGKSMKNSDWHVRYVPLCHFPDYMDNISELRESREFHTSHIAPDFINNNVEGSRKHIARVKPKKCAACALFAVCEGIWRNYLAAYGDGELRPILRK